MLADMFIYVTRTYIRSTRFLVNQERVVIYSIFFLIYLLSFSLPSLFFLIHPIFKFFPLSLPTFSTYLALILPS